MRGHFRYSGTLMPVDDWPEGATLGSVWCLEAICAGVSALPADPPLPSTPQARVSSYPSPAEATSAPSQVWMISCSLLTWATFVPPAAWATSALSSRGVDPPTTLM